MTEFLQWLDTNPLFWPMFIFLARVTDVSLGTIRTILVVRGNRLVAPILGFFEVLVWVIAISGIFRHLDVWYNIIAWAGGFALGNAMGIFIEQKIAMGMQTIRFISRSRSAAVAAGLRLAGYGVTEIKGQGMEGEVSISFVVIPRRETETLIKIAQKIDPEVFSTVEDIRTASFHNYRSNVPPTGWRSIMKKK